MGVVTKRVNSRYSERYYYNYFALLGRGGTEIITVHFVEFKLVFAMEETKKYNL